jgi:V/A-type H+-transporting ATPase subunit E
MSLDNILQALEIEAQHQIAEIEQNTHTELERIEAETRRQVEVVRKRRLEAIQAPLQLEKTRIINQAKQEALQIVLGSRENLITGVLEVAAQRLAALSNTEFYPQLLQQLLQEAVDTLGICDQLHLRVQSQDETLMEQIVQDMGLSARIEGNLQNEGMWGADLGGLEAATADGRINLVNTLEARLQRVASLYRAQIVEYIFDQKAGD